MSIAPEIFTLIQNRNIEGVEAFVSHEKRVINSLCVDGQSPIIFAKYQQLSELVDIIMKSQSEMALSLGDAAALGKVERLRELIALDPEQMDDDVYEGMTALHLAARFGHANAVELLLEHGASPTMRAKNETRALPIHCAVLGGDAETVELLLEAEMLADAPDGTGRTPVHYASTEEKGTILQILLKYGGNPEALSFDGMSPTELASEKMLRIFRGINKVFL